MISFVRGRVAEVEPDRAVLDVGGVGLAIFASGRQLSALSRQVGEQVTVQTYLHVREDTLQIYGFADAHERAFFQALIAVSGVGPKVALSVLSGYPVNELELAVVRDDALKFESISGIGKKLAQRLVVELKDRVAAGVEGPGGALVAGDERAFMLARSALQNLGLSVREAEEALRGAPGDAAVEDLVKYALKRSEERM